MQAVSSIDFFKLFEEGNSDNPIVESWLVEDILREINKLKDYELTWRINRSVTVKNCKRLNIVDANVLYVKIMDSGLHLYLDNATVGTVDLNHSCSIFMQNSTITDIEGSNIPLVSIQNSCIMGETGMIDNLVLLSDVRLNPLNNTINCFSDNTLFRHLIVNLKPERNYDFTKLTRRISVMLSNPGAYYIKVTKAVGSVTILDFNIEQKQRSAVQIKSDEKIEVINENKTVTVIQLN